jgi:hypothetical protein
MIQQRVRPATEQRRHQAASAYPFFFFFFFFIGIPSILLSWATRTAESRLSNAPPELNMYEPCCGLSSKISRRVVKDFNT